MKIETPLLKYLRALAGEDREKFAEACGTKVVYLYQMAGQAVPNPRLRLAKAICEQSTVFLKRIPKVMRQQALTYDDLLVGAEEEGEPSE